MSQDKKILYSIWILTTGLLIIFVPRKKLRQGILSFLFKQVITWLFGLVVVEKGLITYPVRFFRKANKTSFSFEYYFYPAMCAIFNLYFPTNKSNLAKLMYVVSHSGILTLIEVGFERYTNLIKYKKWTWYWSFITMSITYYASHLFYKWFFKYELTESK